MTAAEWAVKEWDAQMRVEERCQISSPFRYDEERSNWKCPNSPRLLIMMGRAGSRGKVGEMRDDASSNLRAPLLTR